MEGGVGVRLGVRCSCPSVCDPASLVMISRAHKMTKKVSIYRKSNKLSRVYGKKFIYLSVSVLFHRAFTLYIMKNDLVSFFSSVLVIYFINLDQKFVVVG